MASSQTGAEAARRRAAAESPAEAALRRSTMPCRHLKRGVCLYGDGCAFSHSEPPSPPPPPPPLPSVELLQAEAGYREALARLRAVSAARASKSDVASAAANLQKATELCHSLRPARPTSRYVERPKVRNKERAGALRRFLLDTYGLEALSAGGGVLDIAGGQGALGFELLNLNGVPVTVVDPRPMTMRRLGRKWERGLYFRTEPLQKYNTRAAPRGDTGGGVGRGGGDTGGGRAGGTGETAAADKTPGRVALPGAADSPPGAAIVHSGASAIHTGSSPSLDGAAQAGILAAAREVL